MKPEHHELLIREPLIDDAKPIAAIQVAGWQSAFRGVASNDYLDALDAAAEAAGWRIGIALHPNGSDASSPSLSPRSSDSSPSSRHATRTSIMITSSR